MAEELRFSQMLRQKIRDTLSSLPFSSEVERRVGDGLQKTLSLLDIPTRDEIRDINDRLDDLLQRCDAILKKE